MDSMVKKSMGWQSIGWLAAAILFWSGSATAQAQGSAPQFQEGVHYTAIKDAPAFAGNGVEVVEAFSYMCTHCATFEPYITSWKQRKADNVEFRRIPVVFGRGSWEIYARAYVTAELMGIADKAHGPLMDKIWKDREVLRSIEELAEFYSDFGVSAKEFIGTSKSFAVDARMRKDQRAVQVAGVTGTPSLVVNGKYLVAGNAAVANYDVMLKVVDFLADKELADQSAALATAAAAAVAPVAAEGGAAED
jgi:protein dithiol oxidoreductase (disulfide-forming)